MADYAPGSATVQRIVREGQNQTIIRSKGRAASVGRQADFTSLHFQRAYQESR